MDDLERMADAWYGAMPLHSFGHDAIIECMAALKAGGIEVDRGSWERADRAALAALAEQAPACSTCGGGGRVPVWAGGEPQYEEPCGDCGTGRGGA